MDDVSRRQAVGEAAVRGTGRVDHRDRRRFHHQAGARRDSLECGDAVGPDRIGVPARRGGRDDGDSDRPAATHPSRRGFEEGLQEWLVPGREFGTAVEGEGSTHATVRSYDWLVGPSDGGVTFLIGGRGGSWRPRRIRRTCATRSGPTTNGAMYAMTRIGIKNRVAGSERATANARSQRHSVYAPMTRPLRPASWSRRAGSRTTRPRPRASAMRYGAGSSSADGRPHVHRRPASCASGSAGERGALGSPHGSAVALRAPQDVARTMGWDRPAPRCGVHRLDRLRRVVAGAAAVLHASRASTSHCSGS